MSVQERFNTIDQNLNLNLEKILKESRYEMQERKDSILLDLESRVVTAKKDVRHHISELVKIQSVVSNSSAA